MRCVFCNKDLSTNSTLSKHIKNTTTIHANWNCLVCINKNVPQRTISTANEAYEHCLYHISNDDNVDGTCTIVYNLILSKQ